MAFILISLIALFIMSLVTNQFNQMSTQEVSYSEFLDMVNGTGKWEGRSVKSVRLVPIRSTSRWIPMRKRLTR